MKTVIAILFFAVSAFAQNSPVLGVEPVCGPPGVNFDTVASAGQPPAKPESGKALVYVVADFPGPPGAIGTPTIKIGVDGKWVGATHGRSYVFFVADEGEHHLCINWQSRWEGLSKIVSFAHVVAEPGKTYYFRARALYYSHSPMYLDLDAIDADEGKYLVSISPLSTAHPKK